MSCVGSLLFAANLVAEYEWEFGGAQVHRELKLDLGASYAITPHFSVGVEARQHNVLPAGEGLKYSVLFVGPVLSVSSKSVWPRSQ